MNEKDLNIEYICKKTLLNKGDELVPIILDLIQESYKAGLCQAEFDNTMDLIEEIRRLKKQLENKYEKVGTLTGELLYEENTKLINQQKEFINYLEDEIKRINPNNLEIGELNLRLDDIKFTQYLIYKEILRKYKEIIGISNENNMEKSK